MTHIEELKAAVVLIRYECIKHIDCFNCPLNKVICHRGKITPASWEPERLEGEDDD